MYIEFIFYVTKVFVDVLSDEDLMFVTSALYPDIEPQILCNMISFNSKVFLNILVTIVANTQ